MTQKSDSTDLGSKVYGQLKQDIVIGSFPPGVRLAPATLSKKYETSTTVVREALVQLSTEYLVVKRPGQGFAVVSYTEEELQDITKARINNDVFALELSIKRGDIEWETRVMSTHHILFRTPRRDPEDPKHTRIEWTNRHRDFHSALISGSNIPLLMDLSKNLFDLTELYRRIAAPSAEASNRNVEEEHKLINDATVARDTKKASTLLADHYEHTMDMILIGLRNTAK